MPKCFVKKCSHSTGQKSRHPEVSLHHFPKDIKLIQEWLRLAGVEEENLAFISMEILEDKRSDKYRMCSAHFTKDSYVMKGLRRFLKDGARPCIFRGSSEMDYSRTSTMQRIVKQAQVEQSVTLAPVGLPVRGKCTCNCHIHLKARLVSASTQTEASDFLTLSLVQTNSRLPNPYQGDHDYLQRQRPSGPKPPTAHKSMDTDVAPSANCHLIPVKFWEKSQHLESRKNHEENGFLNSNRRSHLDDVLQEKAIIPSEGSPYNVSVNSWGTVEIKQENAQNQRGILLEKPRFANKFPLFDPIFNRNRQDYVTGLKKEDPINEYGFLHKQETKSNTSSEKPLQWRVMPSSGKKSEQLERIYGEVHSFDRTTVDESVNMQKENAQKENHIVQLEETMLERGRHNNIAISDVAPNQNADGYACRVKKENTENEYNLSNDKDEKTIVEDSSTHRPVKTNFDKTEEWDDLQKKKGGHYHDGTTDTDNSTDEESPRTRRKRRKIDPSMSAKLSDAKCSKSLNDKVPPFCSKEKKYVVFESSLDALLVNMHCQQKYCTAKIKEFNKRTMGSLLVVFGTCCEGHYTKLWESQPRVNGIGAGNVLLAALLVLTGLEFAKIKELCDLVSLQISSESSLHQYRDNIYPVIDQWMQDLK